MPTLTLPAPPLLRAKFARLWGLVGLGATLGGCAFTDGHVKLDPIPTASAAHGGGGRELVVFPATDTRTEHARCGVKRNTYGSETADVLCTPEPSAWLSELVLRGLDRAKFKIVTTQTAQSADPLRIRLRLAHLFIDQIPGMMTVTLHTDVNVVVSVESKAGLVAERSFLVQTDTEVAAVLDRGLKDAMDQATARLVDRIVDAVLVLSKRYPSSEAAATVVSSPGMVVAIREVRP
jgi:hypothetical protein